ncbi:MAG: 4,5-dihydroxyphthalate dehydrogenase [Hyphomicrobiales bacterium]|nr:4,5-dihydroxyphthalate dehydrogenase [Hyphomicrobiales bacterium]
MSQRKVRLGIAGLGRAFSFMIPTFRGDPRIEIVAGADPRAEARDRFAADFNARPYATVEELCADPNVDAIYIASPHQFHAPQVAIAAAHGKHALVEKPMALSLEECRAMIAATRAAGTHLLVGHSHSFDAPIQKTRDLVASGAYGRLRMITAMNFTDFLYRPRRPEELDTAAGGGAVYNQAPHQVEMIRLIGGGKVKSVRAATGIWDKSRPTEGAYTAFLTFEDGVVATMTYSGYAHFDSDEFSGWYAESGLAKDPDNYGASRAALRNAPDLAQETALKEARNYGGEAYADTSVPAGRKHQNFGLLIASCAHGDLRPNSEGVQIYADLERSFEPIAPPGVPRSEVMDELVAAVLDGTPPLHSGEWSMATMEVCLAILQSASEGREIELKHQVGLPTAKGGLHV